MVAELEWGKGKGQANKIFTSTLSQFYISLINAKNYEHEQDLFFVVILR